MKFLALAFALISFNSRAAVNSVVECYRGLDSNQLTYRFTFAAPRVVSAWIKVTGPTGEVMEGPVESRSVLYSQGRLVGMMNEHSGDEELFLLPTAIFNPANLNQEMKVEVMLRGNAHFFTSCQAIL